MGNKTFILRMLNCDETCLTVEALKSFSTCKD